MWKLIFDNVTKRGTGCNREPFDGEFAVDLPPSECAWFMTDPTRYMWDGGKLVDWPTWEAEEAERVVAEAKKLAEANIRANGSSQLLALGAPYSSEERETWMTQEAEARAWTADDTAPCPMVTAMAVTRGIPLSLMAQKIIENADLFKSAAGQILGQQQKALDEL